MVSLATNYFYVTSGTLSGDTISGGITVQIYNMDVKHNLTKTLTEIARPSIELTTDPAKRYLIDLKDIKEVITVTGFLKDIDGGDTRFTQKENLRILAGTGTSGPSDGIVTVVWGTDAAGTKQTYNGNIIKCEFRETAREDRYNKIAVTLQIVIGEARS